MIGALAPVAHIPAPSIDWFAIAPDIALFAAALLIVLGRSLFRHDSRIHEASLTVAIAGGSTPTFRDACWKHSPTSATITSA